MTFEEFRRLVEFIGYSGLDINVPALRLRDEDAYVVRLSKTYKDGRIHYFNVKLDGK